MARVTSAHFPPGRRRGGIRRQPSNSPRSTFAASCHAGAATKVLSATDCKAVVFITIFIHSFYFGIRLMRKMKKAIGDSHPRAVSGTVN
jgi:hypothetical protein